VALANLKTLEVLWNSWFSRFNRFTLLNVLILKFKAQKNSGNKLETLVAKLSGH